MKTNAIPTRSIYPDPVNVDWKHGVYEFGNAVTLYCNSDDPLQLRTMRELWGNFTTGSSTLEVRQWDAMPEFCAVIANTEPALVPQVAPGFEYTVRVTEHGFELAASDRVGLTHAFFTALQLFHPMCLEEGAARFRAPYVSIQDRPDLAFRGIHLCVFPETSLLLLEKAIKMAGFMKLTHVVLEFWGTLQFDVMSDLHWRHRFFTKEEIRPLVDMAHSMGMEVVPMFNHLGHASGSRERYGRHVVLNQNPKHALLFEPDGWTWCLSNPETLRLLRAIRQELMELCGPGGYFHVGCDEAYSYATCDRCRHNGGPGILAEYLNGLEEEMGSEGRRIIMWGDALLKKTEWSAPYTATGTMIPRVLPSLSRNIVIADWQYSVTERAVATAEFFMAQGFDTLLCPWDRWANITSLSSSAKDTHAMGVLVTTWHHLPEFMPVIPSAAMAMWGSCAGRVPHTEVAAMLRKLVLTETYEDSGWSSREVDY